MSDEGGVETDGIVETLHEHGTELLKPENDTVVVSWAERRGERKQKGGGREKGVKKTERGGVRRQRSHCITGYFRVCQL